MCCSLRSVFTDGYVALKIFVCTLCGEHAHWETLVYSTVTGYPGIVCKLAWCRVVSIVRASSQTHDSGIISGTGPTGTTSIFFAPA